MAAVLFLLTLLSLFSSIVIFLCLAAFVYDLLLEWRPVAKFNSLLEASS